jgi:hypothetical protein
VQQGNSPVHPLDDPPPGIVLLEEDRVEGPPGEQDFHDGLDALAAIGVAAEDFLKFPNLLLEVCYRVTPGCLAGANDLVLG